MTIYDQKNYPMVDLSKFCMAFAVIIIHRPLFGQDFLNYLTQSVFCSVAVPFFFITSSFFFFRKLQAVNRKSTLLHFEKRLLILYSLWTTIYLPCIFVKNHTGHYDEITLKMCIGDGIALMKGFIFSSSFVHFWYINTLMLSVAILYFLRKKLSAKWILGICAMLSAGAILMKNTELLAELRAVQLYRNAVPKLFQNTLESGLVCCALGCFAAQRQKSLRHAIPYLSASGIWMTLCGCLYYEKVGGILFLALRIFAAYLTAWLILICCLQSDTADKPVYQTLRRYSTLIYFSHLLLMSEGFRFIAEHTGWHIVESCEMLRFGMTVVFTLAFSTLILKLQKKCKLLHYLY